MQLTGFGCFQFKAQQKTANLSQELETLRKEKGQMENSIMRLNMENDTVDSLKQELHNSEVERLEYKHRLRWCSWKY